MVHVREQKLNKATNLGSVLNVVAKEQSLVTMELKRSVRNVMVQVVMYVYHALIVKV